MEDPVASTEQNRDSVVDLLSGNPFPAQDSRTFQTVGGDNTAEAQFSSAKHQLRRQNLLGRAGAKRATSALLAGPYQNHVPGLAPLLQAFSVYFMDRLGVDPYKVFEEADPWHVLDV